MTLTIAVGILALLVLWLLLAVMRQAREIHAAHIAIAAVVIQLKTLEERQ